MEGLANWATRRSLLLQRRFALAREQPKAMKSRMTRECHVRICEGLGVKFPGATRPTGTPDRRRRVLDECLGDLPLTVHVLASRLARSLAQQGGETPRRFQRQSAFLLPPMPAP